MYDFFIFSHLTFYSTAVFNLINDTDDSVRETITTVKQRLMQSAQMGNVCISNDFAVI